MFWRRLFRKRDLPGDLADELDAHLAIEARQLMERGLSSRDAETRAQQGFGNRTLTAETLYESWGFRWLDRLGQDLRYAFRSLRQRPSFAVAAVLSLALGIGATTAVFAITDTILLRPLPYPEGDRLLWVAVHFPGNREFLASPDYVAWRRDNEVFSDLAAAQANGGQPMLLNGNPAQEVDNIRVSSNFLAALGVSPMLGRNFSPAEEMPDGPRVVLLSARLWRTRFAGKASVVGQPILLDGQSYSVVGVLPQTFQFPMDVPVDLLTPLPVSPTASHHDRTMMAWAAYGRLKPGATIAAARADLEKLFSASKRDLPLMFRADTSLVLETLQQHRVGDSGRILSVLVVAVGCLLLITCANVSNLLLGRWSARSGEFALRAALGAGRLRLSRQLFTEAAVLTACGTAFGSALLLLLLRIFRHYAASELPRLADVQADARVFSIALLVSGGTTVLFAALPVLRAGGRSLQPALQQFARFGVAGRNQFVKRFLVVLEVALSLLLLCGASLLLETLWHLRHDHLGFAPEHATMISIPLKGTVLEKKNRQATMDEFIAFLHHLPGTEAAAETECSPLTGGALFSTFSRADRPMPEGFHRGDGISLCGVGDEYPAAAGVHLIEGRFFTAADAAQPNTSVVLNQAAVRQFFPRENALGKRVLRSPEGPWKTVIGVVSNSKNAGLNAPAAPQGFVNGQTWADAANVQLIVRTLADPKSFDAQVSQKLHQLDPGLIAKFESLNQQLSEATAGPRFNTVLVGVFAGMAFLMTVVGIYGVLAFAVTQRTQEIGIRLALGAEPGRVLAMIMREGAVLVSLGIAAGFVAFWYLSHYLQSFLYGVSLQDPRTYAGVLMMVILVATAAMLIPARRAASVDPVSALRHH